MWRRTSIIGRRSRSVGVLHEIGHTHCTLVGRNDEDKKKSTTLDLASHLKDAPFLKEINAASI